MVNWPSGLIEGLHNVVAAFTAQLHKMLGVPVVGEGDGFLFVILTFLAEFGVEEGSAVFDHVVTTLD